MERRREAPLCGERAWPTPERKRRSIAAGKREWLYPEQLASGSWADLAATLLPPRDELWDYGGETYVGFEDGSVRYQGAYLNNSIHSERLGGP